MSVENLLQGYQRFRTNRFEETREVYRKLNNVGQSPKVMIIACCDSRVDPATILDAGPGELFITRNVANLVPPYTPDNAHHGTSAALEFAVKHLKVEDIIIMGHAQCGGAKALLMHHQFGDRSEFIDQWMRIASSARDNVMLEHEAEAEEDLQQALEHEIIRLSLRNLMEFSWIREAVGAGRLTLHGWYFGIAKGLLYRLNPETNTFETVADKS